MGVRTAILGESGRGGTGRTMLAMQNSGDFGASRLSGGQTAHCERFELKHLLLVEPCCRSSWHLNIGVHNATKGFVPRKAAIMPLRSTTLAAAIAGLIATLGLTGCQVPRSLRSFEFRSSPWRRLPEPAPRYEEDRLDSEVYVPESHDVPRSAPQPVVPQPSVPDQPKLRLPPDPAPATELRPIPVPPAAELDLPQARRWKPSQPNRHVDHDSQFSSQSESSLEEPDLPPARVTYDSELPSDEPIITPSPERGSSTQPRLFRPAGTARNMFDTVKRKLSR